MGDFTEAQLLRQIDHLTDELAHNQMINAQLRENLEGLKTFWTTREKYLLDWLRDVETQNANLRTEVNYWKARSLPPDGGGDMTMRGGAVLRPKDGG